MTVATASKSFVILSFLLLQLVPNAIPASIDAVREDIKNYGTESRQLANQYMYNDDNTTFVYDLSEFSVRFEKCQSVQMFDDELARDASGVNGSPLASYHFVVFKLCPSDTCSLANSKSTDTCGPVYGSYTLDVASYLQSTVEYQKEVFELMCTNCEEVCEDEESCTTECGQLCYQHNNLEANGKIDASDYLQCQKVQIEDGNDNDEDNVIVYVGPQCSQDSASILLGVFLDENCLVPTSTIDIATALGATPSYHIVATTYTSTSNECISCMENVENNEENADADQWDSDQVNKLCERLYDEAAKCESDTGLDVGFIQTMRKQEEENEHNNNNNNNNNYYSNQVENEPMACTFIQSLIWNSYTQTGEINFSAKQDVIVRQVTKKQKLCLGLVSAAFITMIGLVFYLQQSIKRITSQSSNNGSSKIDVNTFI
jgi:hypothetical protein